VAESTTADLVSERKMKSAAVYLLATLDTKGIEAAYLRDRLCSLGIGVKLVDTGFRGPPSATPDVTRDAIFTAAGTSAADGRLTSDRGQAVSIAAEGAAEFIREQYVAGDVAGVLGLGGGAGTIIGTAAMRALPLGVPKLMVSTLTSGQIRQYVGEKDIFMLNAVVDIVGLNRISRLVLDEAARAMAGLVARPAVTADDTTDSPVVALTMFGVTTPSVEHARRVLEAAGYETLVFHATGSGGRTMESLVRDGLIAGVLDITTTELADEVVGGFLSAGPDRLTAAGLAGIPQVVSVGATDMVNFYAIDTVPERFRSRRLHQHDSKVTLMRTTPEENIRIGEAIGRKLAAAAGPVAIYLPHRGVSRLDDSGQPFDNPVAREALFDAIRTYAPAVEIIELDQHINDAAFAEAAARKLIQLLKENKQRNARR
jgi:uncharacterized protein (UPF0261 family)